MLAKENQFVSLTKRLMRIDKVVNITQKVIRDKSIALYSSYDRVPALYAIVREYLALITEKEYPNFDNDKVLWGDLCRWYVTRQTAMLDVETRFGNFVDDLREREGRLFHRWVKYTLRDNESGEANEETEDQSNEKQKDEEMEGGGYGGPVTVKTVGVKKARTHKQSTRHSPVHPSKSTVRAAARLRTVLRERRNWATLWL